MRTEISFPLSSKAVAVRVSLLYMIGSALWVVFSDAILHHFIRNAPVVVWSLETTKGLVYVVVSGLLLGAFIYRSHRHQEKSRLVTESKLRKLRESGLIGIFSYDVSGTVNQANEAFLRMLGYSRDELRAGRISLSRITPPEYVDLNIAMDRTLLERGFSPLYEAELTRKDGSQVPILGGRALLAEDDARGIAYTLDISQLKTAEAEKEKLRAQLVQSEKLNALGQLAGGVAHDFNNLLGIIVASQFLAKESIDPASPAYDNIERSIRAAHQATALTRKLLAFGRRQVFRPEVLHLNKLVREHCAMLENLIDKNIHIYVEPSADCWVFADPAQVEQVLMNLLLNARDAISGHGHITVKTGPHARLERKPANARQYVALTVSDTGSGIAPEVLSHIFEPFFTTKGKHAGTGLGLSTVYGIVKQNEGEISVESTPGRGTSFTVLLPRAEANSNELQPEGFVHEINRSPSTPQITVLLVEYSTDLLLSLTNILETAGYRVLQAQSKAEAIHAAEHHNETIDVILCDVTMPGVSGAETVAQVLKIHPTAKPVFLSGYAEETFPGSGAIFVGKPLEPVALLAAIRRALEYQRVA